MIFTPIWLKEIIHNYENIINNKNSSNIILFQVNNSNTQEFESIDDFKFKTKNNAKFRIAFLRDGPFLPVTTGAVYSIYEMMNALTELNCEVFLIYSNRFTFDQELYKNQKFTTVVVPQEQFYENEKLYKKLSEELNIDYFQLDSAEAVVKQTKILKQNKAQVVFEVHNVEHDLLRQIPDIPKQEILRIEKLEKEAYELSDLLLCRSTIDVSIYNKLVKNVDKFRVFKGGINDSKFIPQIRNGKSNKVIFLGHLNYFPNANAVQIIDSKIAPKTPKIQYLIAGKGDIELKSLNANKKNWVDDLNKFLLEGDIALAPLINGSGTRLKVLDYLASGLAVIATNKAIEGLEPEIKKCLIVEDDIEKYPEIINDLFKHPEKIKKLSILGPKFIKKYRSWKVCALDLTYSYENFSTKYKQKPIAIEGMPRSGKSTFVNTISTLLEDKVTIENELYFDPAKLSSMVDPRGNVDDSIYFLELEIQRAKRMETNKTRYNFVDRTWISTLAYSYARSSINKSFDNDYNVVLNFVKQNIKEFPDYSRFIVLLNEVYMTIGNRREDGHKADVSYWMNEEFMEYYKYFYEHELQKLIPKNKLVFIQTHLKSKYDVFKQILKNC
jgi:glycosyltransferase involved in cell wall biosynthesis/thymidylate kinase